MTLNTINSKVFFGTKQENEANKLFKFLQQFSVRCKIEAMVGKDAVKRYKDDPFHFYAKSFIEKLDKFHIIRVHRLDFNKACDLYNIDYF